MKHGGSQRALALASCYKKSWASSDHLPPVSQASTQTGPTLVAREFWIPEFFGSPRLVQRSPVTSNTLPSWNTICSDNTDHSGVDSQLSAMKKWETVGHHFQATVVHPWHGQEVQILHPDVLGDPSTCFSTDSGSATLQRKPTAAQDPCVSTSSPVMATNQVAGHTGKWQTTREDGTKGDEGAAPENTAGQNEWQQRLGNEERDAGHGTSLRSC